MSEQPHREGEPAAAQARENAERVSDPPEEQHRREGEPAAEQAREEET